MKEFKIETNVQCFSYDELPDIYQTLIDKAKQQTPRIESQACL